jgi:hypothetical protein
MKEWISCVWTVKWQYFFRFIVIIIIILKMIKQKQEEKKRKDFFHGWVYPLIIQAVYEVHKYESEYLSNPIRRCHALHKLTSFLLIVAQ